MLKTRPSYLNLPRGRKPKDEGLLLARKVLKSELDEIWVKLQRLEISQQRAKKLAKKSMDEYAATRFLLTGNETKTLRMHPKTRKEMMG